jgi:hypothetical protein
MWFGYTFVHMEEYQGMRGEGRVPKKDWPFIKEVFGESSEYTPAGVPGDLESCLYISMKRTDTFTVSQNWTRDRDLMTGQ